MSEQKRPKAVIVGGSIAGLACAHAIILAGWDVVLVEKSISPPKRSQTGAGLAFDSLTQRIVGSWIKQPHLLHKVSLPLSTDQNQAVDGDKKLSWVLTRDEHFNYRATHWADLHGLLYNALPSNVVLWGHLFISFCISSDNKSVSVKARVLQTDEIVEIVGDLLVAADGIFSSIRNSFLPDFKLRYSGYFAWRGVLDYSENENSECIMGIRKAYPELGHCLYFDLGSKTHTVLYELPNKRLNWLWYVNQPEPEMKMHQEAEKTWVPALVGIIKETKDPFINFIYDSDPLEQMFWDNHVVLVGDAAHPTTPNAPRSTSMSIVDAAVLGICIEKWGAEDLLSALNEYQSIRLPVISKQVLHTRRIGRIKQGLVLEDRQPFDPKTATSEDFEELQLKNMPFFSHVPFPVDSRYAKNLAA